MHTNNHSAAVAAAFTLARDNESEYSGQGLAFAGRDDYLGFVAAWKASYAGTVAAIRKSKRDRRDAALGDDARSSAQSSREVFRSTARLLLAVRRAAREAARAHHRARSPAVAA